MVLLSITINNADDLFVGFFVGVAYLHFLVCLSDFALFFTYFCVIHAYFYFYLLYFQKKTFHSSLLPLVKSMYQKNNLINETVLLIT